MCGQVTVRLLVRSQLPPHSQCYFVFFSEWVWRPPLKLPPAWERCWHIYGAVMDARWGSGKKGRRDSVSCKALLSIALGEISSWFFSLGMFNAPCWDWLLQMVRSVHYSSVLKTNWKRDRSLWCHQLILSMSMLSIKYSVFLDSFLLFHWMRNSAHYQLPSEVLNHKMELNKIHDM